MTHKKIKRFSQHGRVRDKKYLVDIRQRRSNELIGTMRDGGYVPVLDIPAAWSVWLRGKDSYGNDVYQYLLTLHGVYYGKRKAKEIYGVLGQDEIAME